MIWLFIAASIVLSCLPLINKKIELQNYIWLLLSIDMYGLHIAGVIVKPYMIFALILPFVLIALNKIDKDSLYISKAQLLGGFLCCLLVTVNVFNSTTSHSAEMAILIFTVYICAVILTSSTNNKSKEQINDVFIAVCFGFGIVFIGAYACLKLGVDIPGIVAKTRSDPGLFMHQTNMRDGLLIEAYRLRGFTVDPNTVFVQFIFGMAACIIRMFKKFSLYYLITLMISVFCIIISSSRMGFICCVVCIAVSCIIGTSRLKSVKKKAVTVIAALSACISLITLLLSEKGTSFIQSILMSYENRSALTDKYGRFSLWKETISAYWEKNPIFGVGLGNLSDLTDSQRMSHNTWLQLIGECGIIIGLMFIAYFLFILIISCVRSRSMRRIEPDNVIYSSMLIGYALCMVSLISVDNISSSFLWFPAMMLLRLMPHRAVSGSGALRRVGRFHTNR